MTINNALKGNYPKLDFPFLQSLELLEYRSLISELHISTQAPVGIVATSLISALSTVFQGLVDVKKPTGQISPVSILTLTIASAGERKGTVEKLCFEPVTGFQEKLRKTHREKTLEWEVALELWKREIKKMQRNSSQSELETEEESDKLIAYLMSMKPTKPREPQIVYNESTPIALFEGMSKKTENAVLLSSEGGGMLNGRAFSDMTKFNSAWDGDEIHINRIRGSFIWKGRLSVAIQVQPGPFSRFLEKRGVEARDSGLLARFLMSYPRTTQGTRFTTGAGALGASYQRYLLAMASHLELVKEKAKSSGERDVIEFDAKAAELWHQTFNNIESSMQVGGVLYDFKDIANRLMDNTSRLAALFHCYSRGINGSISAEVLSDAISVVSWYLAETMSILHQPSVQQVDAVLLDGKLNEYRHANHRYVRKSVVMRVAPGAELRRKDRFNRALDVLIQDNRIRIVPYLDHLVIDLSPWYPDDQVALNNVILQFRNRNN